MSSVVEKGGTGTRAKVKGYTMGGKTGTAEKYPRSDQRYLVSFVGFVPLDDPQVVVYVVIDEPNLPSQENSKVPAELTNQILTEILPYMNIYPDEQKKTEEENTGAQDAGSGNGGNGSAAESGGNGGNSSNAEPEDSQESQNTLGNPNIPAPLEGGQNGNVLNSTFEGNGLTNEEGLTLQ